MDIVSGFFNAKGDGATDAIVGDTDELSEQLFGLCKAGRDEVSIAEGLVDKGADVDWDGPDGKTPLHIACEKGLLGMCKLFVAKGSDLLLRDEDDRTAVYYALKQDREPKIAEILTEALTVQLEQRDDEKVELEHELEDIMTQKVTAEQKMLRKQTELEDKLREYESGEGGSRKSRRRGRDSDDDSDGDPSSGAILKELRMDNRDMKEEISRLKDELDEARQSGGGGGGGRGRGNDAEVERLREKLADAQADRDELHQENEELSRKLDRAEDDIARYKEDADRGAKDDKDSSAAAQKELDALREELDDARAKVGKYRSRCDDLQADLDDARDQQREDNSRIEEEVASLDKRKSKLDRDISRMQDEKKRLEDEIRDLEDEALDAHTRSQNRDREETDRVSEDLEKLRKDKKRAQEELDDLQADLDKDQEKYDRLQADIKSLTEEKAETAELAGDVSALKKERREVEGDIKQLERELRTIEDDLARAKDELADAKAKATQHEEDAAAAESKVKDAERDLADAKKKLADIDREYREKESDLQDLEADLREARSSARTETAAVVDRRDRDRGARRPPSRSPSPPPRNDRDDRDDDRRGRGGRDDRYTSPPRDSRDDRSVTPPPRGYGDDSRGGRRSRSPSPRDTRDARDDPGRGYDDSDNRDRQANDAGGDDDTLWDDIRNDSGRRGAPDGGNAAAPAQSSYRGLKGNVVAEVQGYRGSAIYSVSVIGHACAGGYLVANVDLDPQIPCDLKCAWFRVVDGEEVLIETTMDETEYQPTEEDVGCGLRFICNAANRNDGEPEEDILAEIPRIHPAGKRTGGGGGGAGEGAGGDGRPLTIEMSSKVHTGTLTLTGVPQSTSVRWYRQSEGDQWAIIQGEDSTTYRPTVDDVPCIIRAECEEGEAIVGPIDIDPQIREAVSSRLAKKEATFTVKDKHSGKSRTLLVLPEQVKLREKRSTLNKQAFHAGLKVTLSPRSDTEFVIRFSDSLSFILVAATRGERDVIALTVRSFALLYQKRNAGGSSGRRR